VKPDQPFAVTEFLKPGVDEFCSVLPPVLAKRILSFAERHPKLVAAHWGMEINTQSVSGFLRFYILAKLRGFRPRTWRFQEEQREIENWLQMIVRAAPISAELAIEIAECARLIKGYGDTHKRGSDNYRTIVLQVIEPALAGAMPPRQAAEAIANARTAALLDPEGEALAKCLAAIATPPVHAIAAE
jgi:indolepyruvate ferredoxin oxidoreductase beta subunit